RPVVWGGPRLCLFSLPAIVQRADGIRDAQSRPGLGSMVWELRRPILRGRARLPFPFQRGLPRHSQSPLRGSWSASAPAELRISCAEPELDRVHLGDFAGPGLGVPGVLFFDYHPLFLARLGC
ncbi:MAG: hypothetical protein KAT86_00010, partial [Candidatus Latescibacteria bacterium]|nr:hypothetical protein [Candidatus Latescibacterota bacterium]